MVRSVLGVCVWACGAAWAQGIDAGVLEFEALRAAVAAPDRGRVTQAKALLEAGRPRAAHVLLAELVVGDPANEVIVRQYQALTGALRSADLLARATLNKVEPIVVAAPPWTPKGPRASADAPRVKLAVAAVRPNQIIDEAAWFSRLGVTTTEYPPATAFSLALEEGDGLAAASLSRLEAVPSAQADEELPVWVPLSYGSAPLTKALKSGELVVARYGRRFVALFYPSGLLVGLYDLGALVFPNEALGRRAVIGSGTVTVDGQTSPVHLTVEDPGPEQELRWVEVTGPTAVMAFAGNGYAREFGGRTATLVTLDVGSGVVRWRSAPLVCNARTFIIDGPVAVCGYGFTSEGARASVIELSTGATLQQLRLPSAPDVFLKRGDRLHVRCYRHDVELTLNVTSR